MDFQSDRPWLGRWIISSKRLLMRFLWKLLGQEFVLREERTLKILSQHQYALETLEADILRLHRLRLQLSQKEESPESLRSPSPPVSWDRLAYTGRLRGDENYLARSATDLVSVFRDKHPVLDLGCGPGTFLSLFREAQIPAYGVDANEEAVKTCLDRGLRAERADAVEHLLSLPENSLGGIASFHLVEHLDAEALEALLTLSLSRLRPGGQIVIETPDPRSLLVLSQDFFKDPSHLRPLHPEGLLILMEEIGFVEVRIQGRFPFGANEKLPAPPKDASSYLRDLVKALNEHLCSFRSVVLYGKKTLSSHG